MSYELIIVSVGIAGVGALLFGPKVNRIITRQVMKNPLRTTDFIEVRKNGEGQREVVTRQGEEETTVIVD